MASMPQKKYYRQRAHSNPMADHTFEYPVCPSSFEWQNLYSNNPSENSKIEFLDIGCGYGGLLIELSKLYPDKYVLGLEIRVKVFDYVVDRIKALRLKQPGEYGNIACIRTNSMKYLPNFFSKAQLSKMFFLFPDPHFKKTKHKWRIISTGLLAEYAFVLKIGGRMYIATDVEELYEWMVNHISEHPLFKRLTPAEENDDSCTAVMLHCTEEGKKVERNGGKKYYAIFERIEFTNISIGVE